MAVLAAALIRVGPVIEGRLSICSDIDGNLEGLCVLALCSDISSCIKRYVFINIVPRGAL